MAKYVYNLLDKGSVKKLVDDYTELAKMFGTMRFKKFIADKCLKELDDICNYSLVTFDEHSVFDSKVAEYEKNHKVRYGDDYILISNNTTLTQAEMFWVSEGTKAKYPDGISVSYIIEYGTGIKGTSQDDWQVDVNGHGSKGWSYQNPDNGQWTHTTGLEGRFIYQKLLDQVEKKIDKWINEYLEERGW